MGFWNSSFDDVSSRDVYKMKCALENNYTVIRLVQEEVYKDSFDWKKIILELISKIYDTPKIIYISQNKTLYDNHKNKMK